LAVVYWPPNLQVEQQQRAPAMRSNDDGAKAASSSTWLFRNKEWRLVLGECCYSIEQSISIIFLDYLRYWQTSLRVLKRCILQVAV